MSQVWHATIPKYDELSVKTMWPYCQQVPEIMAYLPDSLPKGRLPDREFLFNIMNTLNPEYVTELVKHATDARNTSGAFKAEQEQIVIT